MNESPLHRLQRVWNHHARLDPLWVILAEPGKKGQWDRAEFFATGRREISEAMDYATSLGYPRKRGTALDFGCGVGRLTQSLGTYFDNVTGVDLSPEMIRLAREYASGDSHCRFLLNDQPDLAQFRDRSFDLVYSNITLQHMEPQLARLYLAEFLRVLAPGGLLLFQLPSERFNSMRSSWLSPVRAVFRKLYWGHWYPAVHGADRVVGMYGIRQPEVREILGSSGGRILDVTTNDSAGPDWVSYRYAVILANDHRGAK